MRTWGHRSAPGLVALAFKVARKRQSVDARDGDGSAPRTSGCLADDVCRR